MHDIVQNHWSTYETGKGFLSYLRHSSHARNYCREQIRHLIETGQVKSITEVGVGGLNEIEVLAPFFRKFPNLKYTGTDWTPTFVEEARDKFPDFNWKQLDIVTCQVEDSIKADVIYSQHVLEHCPGLNPPLKNMLLMANKVLINIFFQPPQTTESIDHSQYPVYHNFYSVEHISHVCRYHGFEPHFFSFNNRDLVDANECQNEVVLIATKNAS